MKVKVWNDNTKVYREMLDEKMIEIPPKGYVEMFKAEANKFLSQFTPPVIDGTGRHVNPKMLRIEYDEEELAKYYKQPDLKSVCMKCKAMFDTEEDLYIHIVKNHSDDLADKEEAIKNIKGVLDAKRKK